MSDSTTSSSPSATSPAAAASSTSSSNNNGGPTSSPLLFFVALGFGVVFTNLWIIVGVKYCFRYNQRNRALRAMGENGEPIDMANLNGARRRRREKKLMTMEEVNERFPLIKYKLWRSTREAQGLPSEGGVTAPPSRAASIRSRMTARASIRASEDSARVPVESSEPTHAGAQSATHHETQPIITSEKHPEPEQRARTSNEADDDDEDEPIQTAVAPELLSTPGDSCAICIDTLEDDDDVRGLTCGHAFHAACVDVWLTSRRARCPLCSADFYVPKPQAPGVEDPSAAGAAVPVQPPPTWIGSRSGMSYRTMQILTRGPAMFSSRPPRRHLVGSQVPTEHDDEQHAAHTNSGSWRSRLRMPRFGRSAPQQQAPQPMTAEHGVPEEIPTPGELEAGRDHLVR